ncbi:MAG: type II secretion system F family protein, partial [Candidatus Saccharimonadales bacterium]|nr:type II secretion system F family protein [Candidatus Saccharimonadales bacterium]
MAKFEYTALNSEGKTVKGILDASTMNSATETLRVQGFKPLSIKAKKTGFDPNNLQFEFLKRKKPKTKDMVVFTRQLSTMINAGVPLVRSLNTLVQQTDNDTFKETILKVAKEVESGKSFGDALEQHPKTFSPVYVNMVRAGEAGGILDEILNRLAMQQEKDAAIKKKLRGAMTYPAVLIVITILAFFALMIFVVPKIGEIVKDLGGEDASLPPQTQILLNVSDALIKSWPIILAVAVAGGIVLRRYIKTDKGQVNFHKFLLKIPILKNVITKVAIARFARIFSSLMSSGVSVLDSI